MFKLGPCLRLYFLKVFKTPSYTKNFTRKFFKNDEKVVSPKIGCHTYANNNIMKIQKSSREEKKRKKKGGNHLKALLNGLKLS